MGTSWNFSDMHFNNYISMLEARECIGKNEITATPTALKQTPKSTLDFLEKNGVKVTEIRSTGRPRRLSEEQVKRILTMRHTDLSFYKIAGITGIPKSTAFDYWSRCSTRRIDEEEVEDMQIKEAHVVLATLLHGNVDEEISELARQGYESRSIEEIAEIMREINQIIRSS